MPQNSLRFLTTTEIVANDGFLQPTVMNRRRGQAEVEEKYNSIKFKFNLLLLAEKNATLEQRAR